MIPRFLQILDSRGNPTLRAEWPRTLPPVTVSVPSGASTGTHEALELRDGGTAWQGKGVTKALQNAAELASKLSWEPADVLAADRAMLSADNTPDKRRYGANAILANSMLQAAVEAQQREQELWQLLAELAGTEPRLPLPFANVLNGGRHAGNTLTLQEFMLVPVNAETFAEATRQLAETVAALRAIISERYGKSQTAVGDEGGFAPDIATPEEACALLMDAMAASGHTMAIAIDAAASEIVRGGKYAYAEDELLTAAQLRERYVELLSAYPIVSLEDPFAEDAFAEFAKLRRAVADKGLSCQIVGDDLTVTNPERIRTAIGAEACDCLLLKINQIGTVSESLEAARIAREAGWHVMVSHRSGETEDTFIADLAVALGTGQIKLGAPVRGERTAKYNRLLEIESRHALSLRPLK